MHIVVVIAYLISIQHLVCQRWYIVKDDKDFVFSHFIKQVCDVVQLLCLCSCRPPCNVMVCQDLRAM